MDKNKEAIINRIETKNEMGRAGFIDVFRRLYNSMCRSCQVKVYSRINKGETHVYELLCDDCRVKAKKIEEEANEAL